MDKLRRYNLIHGECIEEMKKLKDKSIDLILCDLPYGTTNCEWDNVINFTLLWEQYHRIIKDNGAIVLFSAQPFTTKLINSNLKNYKYSWYWIKNKCTGFAFAKHQPMRKVEDINVFYKKKPLYVPQGLIKLDESKIKKKKPLKQNRDDIYKRSTLLKEHIVEYTNYPNNVLFFDKETKTVHPTQKPHDLLEYLIKTYTKEGDLILDNCMGSGSCGVAAAKNNRRFVGIELNKDYFEIAKDRIERAYMEG